MNLEWIGAGRRDADNSQADPSRLLNFHRENLNGKAVVKGVLGQTSFASLGGVFLRAMERVGSYIYVANGGSLSQVDSSGTITVLGSVDSDADTTISSNNGKITVAAAGDLFVFDGATRTTPDTGAFNNVGSVTNIGQRTVVTERGGRRISWSDVVDPDTFDGLNFATAEQRDDAIIRGVAIGGQYWIFKEASIEQWYLTGSAESAEFLAYRPGTLIEFGLKSFGLYTDVPNGGFFVGSDNIAYLVSGGSLQPVSVRGVETAISGGTADRCFYYEDEGHKFCVVRFTDRPAWVYDMSMNEWHERAEGVDFDAWSAVAAVSAFGSFYVGTSMGEIRKLERSSYDATQPLFRRATSANQRNGGEYFTIDSVELLGTIGQVSVTSEYIALLESLEGAGLEVSGDAALSFIHYAEPYRGADIAVRMSKDRGETYGTERVRSMGDLGEYDQRVTLRSLGVFRNAVMEITVSDPVDITFDAQADVEFS